MIIEQLFGKKKLTESEHQIVSFIESNPRIVINLSLEELSEKCYVSQASIIRLCKKMGTKGFSDFKIKVASELSTFALDDKEIHVDVPIPENADCKSIAETFFNLSTQTLRITCSESRFKLGSFASRVAMLYLLDCLYGQIFSLNYEKNKNNLTLFSQRKVERSYFYNGDEQLTI